MSGAGRVHFLISFRHGTIRSELRDRHPNERTKERFRNGNERELNVSKRLIVESSIGRKKYRRFNSIRIHSECDYRELQ